MRQENHKKLPEPDHVPPKTIYQQFKSKMKRIDSKLQTTYAEMQSSEQIDYFPSNKSQTQIDQIIKQLNKEHLEIFSARVIYAYRHFKPDSSLPLVKKILCSENPTFEKFERLKQQQYKRRFIRDIGYMNAQFELIRSRYCLKNYQFYTGNRIQHLHSQEGNYDYLEDRHDYIQWMFPNHFQSMFNSDSLPMSYLQVSFFRKSRQIGQKMLKSIRIFFDFLGIKILQNYDFQIVQIQRLKDALLINCHNHLRIRRILACLSITGFRTIALRLLQFLCWVPQHCPGFKRLQNTVERDWKIYGDNDLEKALDLCFHPDNRFPEPHIVLHKNNFIDPSQIKALTVNYLKNKNQHHANNGNKSAAIANLDHQKSIKQEQSERQNKQHGIENKTQGMAQEQNMEYKSEQIEQANQTGTAKGNESQGMAQEQNMEYKSEQIEQANQTGTAKGNESQGMAQEQNMEYKSEQIEQANQTGTAKGNESQGMAQEQNMEYKSEQIEQANQTGTAKGNESPEIASLNYDK